MRILRTEDMRFVRYVISRPEIAKKITDDDSAEIPLVTHPKFYYLAPMMEFASEGVIEEIAIGVLLFVPVNGVTWNPHIAILPKYHGNGTQVMRLGVQWMFDNTPCKKIVAFPPAYNKPMVRVFEKCGFIHEGLSTKSIQRDGRLYDRFVFGKEKVCGEQ